MKKSWPGIFLFLLPFAYTALLLRSALWNPGIAILFRDVGSLTLPAKRLVAESILRFGELPGWNPFVLGGVPFLADPSFAVYYPMNLIFLLFPERFFSFAHTWYLAAHIPLAFAGYFLFFRRFSGHTFFAALAALTLAGGSYAVSSFYMSGALSSLLAAGWLFYFWSLYLGQRKNRYLFLASFFLTLPVYGGDPQASYLLGIFFLPALAFSGCAPRSALSALARIFPLAFLAAAPQVLPTADLLLQSPRTMGAVWLANTEVWSLHPLRLLEWVIPLPFGNSIYAESAITGYVNGPDPMPFIFSVYGGFFFLPAFAAICSRKLFRRKEFLIWLGLAVFFVLVALGSYGRIPVNRLVGSILPLWSGFRYPERLLVFAQISLLLATGFGLKNISVSRFLPRFAWAIHFGLVALLACAAFRFPGAAVRQVFFPAGFLFLFFALAVYAFRKSRERALLVMLVLFTAIDLAGNLNRIVFTVPAKLASEDWPPFLRLVKQEWGLISLESFPRFFSENEARVNWSSVERISGGRLDLVGKVTLHQWLMLVANTGSYFHLGTPLGFSTLMNRRQQIFWDAVAERDPARAISLKGTNFIGSVRENGDFSVLRNKFALPLFSAPSGVDGAKGETDALAKVASPGWDWKTRIVVQGVESAEQSAEFQFRVTKRTFNRITLAVHSSGPTRDTWVLWNESFDHFWSLTNAGREIPLFRANYWASAFRLPAMKSGEERVLEFEYENPAAKLGQALFLVWVLLAGLFLYREKRKGAS